MFTRQLFIIAFNINYLRNVHFFVTLKKQ